MAKKNKPKVEQAFRQAQRRNAPPEFDVEKIAKRLRFIDVPEFLHGIYDAIDEAKSMAGSLDPETCDETREALEQLRKTVAFVFGVER
jgi:hypothetical protein